MISAGELMNQASATAGTYMARAIREANECFGDDWVHKNRKEAAPYVAAHMQAAALDFHACFIGGHLEKIGDVLSDLSDSAYKLSKALESLADHKNNPIAP
jgi:hypothetical protein